MVQGGRPGVPEPDEAQDTSLDWERPNIGFAKRTSRLICRSFHKKREHRASGGVAREAYRGEEGADSQAQARNGAGDAAYLLHPPGVAQIQPYARFCQSNVCLPERLAAYLCQCQCSAVRCSAQPSRPWQCARIGKLGPMSAPFPRACE